MPIEREQQEKIRDWCREKLPASCAVCRQVGKWRLGPEMVVCPAVTPEKGMQSGLYIVPMVQIICGHCGWVGFFDAKTIGLEPPSSPVIFT